jgi:hypothetical protein
MWPMVSYLKNLQWLWLKKRGVLAKLLWWFFGALAQTWAYRFTNRSNLEMVETRGTVRKHVAYDKTRNRIAPSYIRKKKLSFGEKFA